MEKLEKIDPEEKHKLITRGIAEFARQNAELDADAASWTTKEATGVAAHVYLYLQVDCNLKFNDGTNVTFNGKGLAVGLGATGALGGSATFNVEPSRLKSLSKVTFEATSIGVVGGGFQVTWFSNGKYVGHGEFYGLGVDIGTPGGGWGDFT